MIVGQIGKHVLATALAASVELVARFAPAALRLVARHFGTAARDLDADHGRFYALDDVGK